MAIAAAPRYLQGEDPEFFLSAPPGHRFLLYFPVWGEDGEHGRVDWRTKDRVRKFKRKTGQLVEDGWTDLENGQFACTIAAGRTPPNFEESPRARQPKADRGLEPWKPMLDAIRNRQTISAERLPGSTVFRLDAVAVAPFTTGLGNEHPLENGFAFLNPYGLPYLPGSGVKGVVRRASQELAGGKWNNTRNWEDLHLPCYRLEIRRGKEKVSVPLSVLDVLFGLESGDGATEHVRGALSFWDVIPDIEGNSLMVEIMTPHQSHYYQQKRERKTGDSTTPHDSGQPNPICFLTVPPRSRFAFHVVCDTAHLARLTKDKDDGAPDLLAMADGRPLWQTLLTSAFEHAFEWLGFGAKTAVGYGAMQRDPQAEARAAKERAEREAAERAAREAAEKEARRAAMSEAMRRIDDFRREFAARAEQLRGGKERPNGVYHGKARDLAKLALAAADWSAEEKRAAADAIEEWLPKVVQVDIKDERKKLKLAALRGQA